ncbi:multiple epidermal growth factor-like domains protein 6 [Haliotis cracherodii]|uniref:multiple epidermal growth factor-like domains protein 6 n=1 Tax=Haliotis cracherodii TaxID=6455 RepID=UPI0039E949E7
MTVWLILCLASLIISAQGDKCKYNQHCSDCDRSTGHCLRDCDPGYFDQTCSSVCSRNCRNHSCQLSSSGSGACTEGCVPGYQGPGCNVGCDSPGGTCVACPGGCDGGYCQLASPCVSGCVDSYFGTDCKTCSSRCKSCNRMTGLCKECHPEYFGPNCAYSCDHCLGSCEHGCALGCLPGLYGTFCEKKCSEKCGLNTASSTDNLLLSSKADLRVCQRTSGNCLYGCREGWFGQQCSSRCSPNCGHNTCQSDSGKCTDGCTRGFYGGHCQHTCEVCRGGVCDQKTGTCTMGCHLTGQTCDFTCTFNCSVAECLRVEHCNQEDTSRRHSGIQLATLLTSLMFLVVGSVVSVTICCRRRVRMLGQHTIQGVIPYEAPSDEDQVPPDYCEIRDEDVNILYELPGIREDESVAGAAPAMPVLAECSAPDCDSADNDAATSEESGVDENTYTHLMRPVLVDVPETVVNYVSPIEE